MKSTGAYAERVDEQIFNESILQRIYNQISKADVITADMTDRNENVFYETGYAHTLGKQVILLIHLPEESISLYQGEWEKIYIDFHTSPENSLEPENTETIVLRTLSHEGGRDFPFNIKFQSQRNKTNP